MTKSNRTRITVVRDSTPETALSTPRMRTLQMVSESLRDAPSFLDDEEINDDRMDSDPVLNFTDVGGGLALQLRYPVDLSPLSELIMSALFNTWTNTPSRDNDGSADSVITAVATTNTEVTHTTGASFVAGHLVRFSGFGVAGNNGVFKCTTGGATSSRYVGSGITDESAPAAAARMKVVGFQGASGDITATSTGLGSTSLDFTTLGLAVGQWIKIGGSAAGDKFATSALNDWARVAAIAATALTLDHRPSGWTTDSGTSKTIKVWFGDTIKNGTTRNAVAIEKGFMGQGTPSYLLERGQTVNRLGISYESKRKIGLAFDFVGQGASQSTTSVDSSPDAAISTAIMAANVNIGRVWEGGSRLGTPNFLRALSIQVDNGLEGVDELESDHNVDIYEGSCTVTGRIDPLFGDLTLRTKLLAGTPTSIAVRSQKDSQAVIVMLPRVIFNGEGNPNAGGKNQKVMLPLAYKAGRDSTTSSVISVHRFEYYE